MGKTNNNDGGDKAPEAPATEPVYVYEVVIDGPVKIGGVLAYKTARLHLTKDRAAMVNEAFPGALKLLGI